LLNATSAQAGGQRGILGLPETREIPGGRAGHVIAC
jgi:hypothetical protein